ncbi:hypothetical protein IID10_16005 [candidate division KSB1 bacterium]|nr:hypothetical protein [candidate division KSB1 bacterium]
MRALYIYGDYCCGRIWMLRYENNSLTADSLLINATVPLSSFGVDEQNELYGVGIEGRFSVFPKGLKVALKLHSRC